MNSDAVVAECDGVNGLGLTGGIGLGSGRGDKQLECGNCDGFACMEITGYHQTSVSNFQY